MNTLRNKVCVVGYVVIPARQISRDDYSFQVETIDNGSFFDVILSRNQFESRNEKLDLIGCKVMIEGNLSAFRTIKQKEILFI